MEHLFGLCVFVWRQTAKASLLIRKMLEVSLCLCLLSCHMRGQLNIDECHQTHHTYAAPPWLGFPLLWPWVTQKLVHRHNIHMFEAHNGFLPHVRGLTRAKHSSGYRMNDQIVSKTTMIFNSDASAFALKEPFIGVGFTLKQFHIFGICVNFT